MIGPVFVDADVLLYARDNAQPVKRLRARAWLEILWRHRLGRTSTPALAEYYVNATRNLGFEPSVAWRDVKRYLAWRPRALDSELMSEAREVERRYRLAWWNSVGVAAARLQGCVLMLSVDLPDGVRFGTVVVRSPFTLRAEQPRAAYSVERLQVL